MAETTSQALVLYRAMPTTPVSTAQALVLYQTMSGTPPTMPASTSQALVLYQAKPHPLSTMDDPSTLQALIPYDAMPWYSAYAYTRRIKRSVANGYCYLLEEFPRELRNKIWEYAVEEDEFSDFLQPVLEHTGSNYFLLERLTRDAHPIYGPPTAIQLGRTCRQIYHEVVETNMFYKLNMLHFSTSMRAVNFFTALPPKSLEAVTAVSISWRASGDVLAAGSRTTQEAAMTLIRSLPNLKFLDVRIHRYYAQDRIVDNSIDLDHNYGYEGLEKVRGLWRLKLRICDTRAGQRYAEHLAVDLEEYCDNISNEKLIDELLRRDHIVKYITGYEKTAEDIVSFKKLAEARAASEITRTGLGRTYGHRYHVEYSHMQRTRQERKAKAEEAEVKIRKSLGDLSGPLDEEQKRILRNSAARAWNDATLVIKAPYVINHDPEFVHTGFVPRRLFDNPYEDPRGHRW